MKQIIFALALLFSQVAHADEFNFSWQAPAAPDPRYAVMVDGLLYHDAHYDGAVFIFKAKRRSVKIRDALRLLHPTLKFTVRKVDLSVFEV